MAVVEWQDLTEFTFHYASTLSEQAVYDEKKKNNLHSTMLLLYRRRIERRCFQNNIYIPLCFYFIGNGTRRATKKDVIYIPLCFYFIVLDSLEQLKFNLIYIPLCFYFI